MSQVIPDAAVGENERMRSIPIRRNDRTMSWEAVCPDCERLVFMVTDEAVAQGPRRVSGSSQLLPVTDMTARHECEAAK